MKKNWYWVLAMMMVLPACGGQKPQEENIEPGMEEEAPIVPEGENDNMLDFEESVVEYQEAQQNLEQAQPKIDAPLKDKELQQELDAAKENL